MVFGIEYSCVTRGTVLMKWSRTLQGLPRTDAIHLHVLCLPFIWRKTFVREQIQSEKENAEEAKASSQTRPNNKSLVIKQSQGALVPSQGLWILT